ncbi:MAG: DnaJ C-terminal domain-containing protein, partial [Bacteroidota bacterium]
SIFDEFFGGGGAGGRRSRRHTGERGSDLRIRLPLTLEEIADGAEKKLKIKHYINCETCRGTGAKEGAGMETCRHCNGTGEIRQVQRSVFGQFMNISTCPVCNGSGQVIKEKCPDCDGEGRVQEEEMIKVSIPAGVEEGNYMPLRGKGHAGRRGGPSGDLIVVIEEKPHDTFRRQNNDIIYELTLSFPEAALGTEKEIPVLNGIESIKIDPGTQPGTNKRLRGKGIPGLNSSGKGDQIVIMNIYVPNRLSAKEKNLLKELAEEENIKPKSKKEKNSKDFFEKIKDALF